MFPLEVQGYLRKSIKNVTWQHLNMHDMYEAAKDPKWFAAIEEIKMIEKNQTWQLVDKPQHKTTIGLKWVYRSKLNADGSMNKYKGSLDIKGYAQIYGVDSSKTLAPFASPDTIRFLLVLAVYELDVKSTFLIGNLE
ncbi:UNVERIFIED_CONTAM: putative mitochondrial protein [Sesamum indicum]